MKITIQKSEDIGYTIATMPIGSIGIRSSDGYIFYRTMISATCLTSYGSSYSGVSAEQRNKSEDAVTILPKGTKIILEVE